MESRNPLFRFFPSAKQYNEWTCGCASTQMMLAYYGVQVHQEYLNKKLETDPIVGTTPENIVKCFKDFGLSPKFGSITVYELVELLDHGTPVLCLLQAWGSQNDYSIGASGHYVVAVGYDTDYIYFQDPYTLSNKVYLTYSELDQRWYDNSTGSQTHHWSLYVTSHPQYISIQHMD